MEFKMSKKNKRLDKILEFPQEICTDIPKITIIGFTEILIENYKGILEYDEVYVKVNTFDGIVNINGNNLKLEKMTEDDLRIIGKIDSIDVE